MEELLGRTIISFVLTDEEMVLGLDNGDKLIVTSDSRSGVHYEWDNFTVVKLNDTILARINV